MPTDPNPPLSLRLSTTEHAALAEAARLRKMTRSAFARQAIVNAAAAEIVENLAELREE